MWISKIFSNGLNVNHCSIEDGCPTPCCWPIVCWKTVGEGSFTGPQGCKGCRTRNINTAIQADSRILQNTSCNDRLKLKRDGKVDEEHEVVVEVRSSRRTRAEAKRALLHLSRKLTGLPSLVSHAPVPRCRLNALAESPSSAGNAATKDIKNSCNPSPCHNFAVTALETRCNIGSSPPPLLTRHEPMRRSSSSTPIMASQKTRHRYFVAMEQPPQWYTYEKAGRPSRGTAPYQLAWILVVLVSFLTVGIILHSGDHVSFQLRPAQIPLDRSRAAKAGPKRRPKLTAAMSAKFLNSSVEGWYPPASSWITDLSAVVNGTGVYGFVFNSSQLPEGTPYGTYNWCNMPHVRAQEYPKASDEYKLEYVEVVSQFKLHICVGLLVDDTRSIATTNVPLTPLTHSLAKTTPGHVTTKASFTTRDHSTRPAIRQRSLTGLFTARQRTPLRRQAASTDRANSRKSRAVASTMPTSTASTCGLSTGTSSSSCRQRRRASRRPFASPTTSSRARSPAC